MDRNADRALYKQLADYFDPRSNKTRRVGLWTAPPTGGRVFAAEYDLSRDSVRRAMAVVRGEGLIITERHGSYVRERRNVRVVHVDHGTISARMPTDPERRAMRIDEGVPILVIALPGQIEELHPADRTE